MNGSLRKHRRLSLRSTAVAAALLCLAILALPVALGWARLDLSFGNLLSACGFLVTLLVLFVSVIPNVESIARTANSAHYGQLDTMYLGILQMGIERPYLRRPRDLPPEREPEYAHYAYIVWNFLETVRDRCAEDATLRNVWGPVIAYEAALHRAWFNSETLQYRNNPLPKFRVEFVDFIWQRFGGPDGVICGNALDDGRGGWIDESWECRSRDDIEKDPAILHWLGTGHTHPG